MLTLEKQKAKLTSLNLRAEVHGDEKVPAADIRFSFDAPNELLSEFDPALKSSFYRKPDAPELTMGLQTREELQDVIDIDDDGNVMTSTAELRGGTSSGEVVADPLPGEHRIAPADLPESGAAPTDPFLADLERAEKGEA